MAIIPVNPGEDIAAAWLAADPGDTLALAAGVHELGGQLLSQKENVTLEGVIGADSKPTTILDASIELSTTWTNETGIHANVWSTPDIPAVAGEPYDLRFVSVDDLEIPLLLAAEHPNIMDVLGADPDWDHDDPPIGNSPTGTMPLIESCGAICVHFKSPGLTYIRFHDGRDPNGETIRYSGPYEATVWLHANHPDVTLRNLEIRGHTIGVLITASRTRVERCVFPHGSDRYFHAGGSDNVIDRCELYSRSTVTTTYGTWAHDDSDAALPAQLAPKEMSYRIWKSWAGASNSELNGLRIAYGAGLRVIDCHAHDLITGAWVFLGGAPSFERGIIERCSSVGIALYEESSGTATGLQIKDCVNPIRAHHLHDGAVPREWLFEECIFEDPPGTGRAMFCHWAPGAAKQLPYGPIRVRFVRCVIRSQWLFQLGHPDGWKHGWLKDFEWIGCCVDTKYSVTNYLGFVDDPLAIRAFADNNVQILNFGAPGVPVWMEPDSQVNPPRCPLYFTLIQPDAISVLEGDPNLEVGPLVGGFRILKFLDTGKEAALHYLGVADFGVDHDVYQAYPIGVATRTLYRDLDAIAEVQGPYTRNTILTTSPGLDPLAPFVTAGTPHVLTGDDASYMARRDYDDTAPDGEDVTDAALELEEPEPFNPLLISFPDGDALMAPLTGLSLHPDAVSLMSETNGSNLHPDFGSGTYQGSIIGIPINWVDHDEPLSPMYLNLAEGWEDDHFDWTGVGHVVGSYSMIPIPSNLQVEEGAGDDHALIVQRDVDGNPRFLFETWRTDQGGPGGAWQAQNLSVFDLQSDVHQRGIGKTSADAAGLPISPLLWRWDEVQDAITRGDFVIPHPMRFTVPLAGGGQMLPATHWAGGGGTSYPPEGTRYRLKAEFKETYSDDLERVVRYTLAEYGLIIADNGGGGTGVMTQGEPNDNWDNTRLAAIFNAMNLPDHFEIIEAPGNAPNGPTWDGVHWYGYSGYTQMASDTGIPQTAD
jgi:hypothetical protein